MHTDIEQKAREVLEEIRPAIQMDGGDVSFVSYNAADQTITVKMSGACQGCAMSEITLKQGIQKMIQERLPEIKEVITEDEL